MQLIHIQPVDAAGTVPTYIVGIGTGNQGLKRAQLPSIRSGAPNLRHFNLNDYSFYLQDNWKLTSRLTLNLGLRYTVYSVVNECDSLELFPVIQGGNAIGTLLSNTTLNFAGSSVGRDVFGNGRTAFRGGYSINYVNDQTLLAAEAVREAVHSGGKLLRQGEFAPGVPYVYLADPDGYEIEIWYE